MPWVTAEQVRDRWPDAATIGDVLLDEFIEAAHAKTSAYAPALDVGAIVPQAYVEAEAMAVRDLYAAHRRDGDVLGFGDGFAVRVRPLSEEVKALLRPQRGVPTMW
jgi:hypothetical protein